MQHQLKWYERIIMSLFKRYRKFMQRNMLVAILTAISTLFSTLVSTQTTIPQWVTPAVTFATLIIGSLYVFRKREKQISLELLSELEDFTKTFLGLVMSGSGENRETQIRFSLDRVRISDITQENVELRMRGSCIKACHDLIEKWFKFYRDEVEYFLKHPKSVDLNNSTRLVSEFTKIVSHYFEEVIDASIDFMNDTKPFPKNLKEGCEKKFKTLKIKYNHFANKYNDYIKRLNKELSQQMESADIISKDLILEPEKPTTDQSVVALDTRKEH